MGASHVRETEIGEEIGCHFLTGGGVSDEMADTIMLLVASRIVWWWWIRRRASEGACRR
jgi:hypothetical protein